MLIPEINVVRNKTYTFVVEGGNDPETPAKYHPFYISDDSIGGYEHKTEAEREVIVKLLLISLSFISFFYQFFQKVKLFAGVHKSRNGKITPTGVGRICNWTPDIKGPSADTYPSFGAYQRSLTLKCEEGEPGIITWTPDQNTPDTVYYQCYTHRYLGWKINVVDSCDLQTQASERDEVYADVEAAPSIQHESKVFPSENFLKQHEKDLIKHHNMNGGLSKNPDLQKSEEFNRLITDGIKAAEALEESINRESLKNGTKLGGPGNHEDERDLLDAIAKIPQVGLKQNHRPEHRPSPRRPQLGGHGLPVFLRPPQNIPFPFYPNKLPPRIPIAMERRPPHRKPISPYLLPQQSIMINHYKKPSFPPPPMVHRQYIKNKVPQYPVKPVLLLGQPTEIKTSPYKKSSSDLVIGKPSKTPIDISPMFLVKKNREPQRQPNIKYGNNNFNNNNNNHKKIENVPVRSTFKDPFDVKTESILIPQHSNTGFKADTIIVESGFRPIRREDDMKRDDSFEESEERISALPVSISRRSDNFEDNFEVEDEAQSAFFEPMFIPSPPDSVALPLVNKTDSQTDYMVADASDRQDIFYLPPNESKRSAVTYDAKAILDTSLLNDPLPSENDFVKLSSKTKQFIKDTPQFAPFTGEIPTDLMLQLSANRDQQSVVTKEKPALISTKLSAVKTNDGTR